MKLLYISIFRFYKKDGKTYGLPANADSFFAKYLDVFDSIKVLGDNLGSFLDASGLTEMTDSRITVEILPSNTHPADFKNDKEIKRSLREEISLAEAILIKPSSRKGIMAIGIAKELGKPYMIEMTGDIHNALRQHPNLLKRLYAPFLYRSIKRAIADCLFGLYVSKEYLQTQFPIKGDMCGCSDVILDFSDADVLNRRYNLIESINTGRQINLALIGFYQGKMKGVDTAIRALAQLPDIYHLNILGNGTETNRNRWYTYARKHGIAEPQKRISFPQPLKSSKEVLNWLDTQDFLVFPTLSEGFGRCVAEAMSRGCVTIATDICTMPELLPKERLFAKKDCRTLASLIRQYTSDTDLLKSAAEIDYNQAQKYASAILNKRRNQFLERFKTYASTFSR